MKVCWYNHFHNGDLFATREIVKNLSQQIPGEHYYLHPQHSSVLHDIGFHTVPMTAYLNNKKGTKIFYNNGIWFINTWIGCYLDLASEDGVSFGNHLEIGISWKLYHKVWKHFAKSISAALNISIEIPDDIKGLIPSVRQDYYTNKDHISKKIDIQKPSVLISNGPALSGQAHQNHDMSQWFEPIIEKYPNVQWIFTRKTALFGSNIFYTQDIFDNLPCDLNQIGELSRYSQVIIGRNSGPFLFCNRRDTLFDPTKTFIATGKLHTDCFPYDIDLPCRFLWHSDFDNQSIKQFIQSTLESVL